MDNDNEVGMEIEVISYYDPKSDLKNYQYPTLDLLKKYENVANPSIVSMESIINTKVFQDSQMELPCALGKTFTNEVLMFDLANAPHLLVDDATGQDETAVLNAVVTSLLYKKHPAELKIVLIDSKKEELSFYNPLINHFLAKVPDEDADPIISDDTKVVRTFHSLCKLMFTRYDLFKEVGVLNIQEYNEQFIRREIPPFGGHGYMPYIVVIIDGFSDMIMSIGKEIEYPILFLQYSQAVGIHMVIANHQSTRITHIGDRVHYSILTENAVNINLNSGGGEGDIFLEKNKREHFRCASVSTSEVKDVNAFIAAQQSFKVPFELPEPDTFLDETSLGEMLSLKELHSCKDGGYYVSLLFSYHDLMSVRPICKELDNMAIPYMIAPFIKYDGMASINHAIKILQSSAAILLLDNENVKKDDFISDLIDYIENNVNSSIIKLDKDSSYLYNPIVRKKIDELLFAEARKDILGNCENFENDIKIISIIRKRNYIPLHDYLSLITELKNKSDWEHFEKLAKALASCGDNNFMFILGGYYMGNGRYSEAFNWVKKAAEEDNGQAIEKLGEMYQKGIGVEKNLSMAIKWYLKCPDNIFIKQIKTISNEDLFDVAYDACNVSSDYAIAYKLYKIAADRGHAPSQCNLGWLYDHGYGVSRDATEANKWFRKSAEKGYRVAQCNLANNLEKGIGIKQDYTEALMWYKKSANSGYARAQYSVARFYENGLGESKNLNEAILWYEKAAKNNYEDSREKADALIKENNPVNKFFKLFN